MTRRGWWAFVAGWLLGGVFWVVSWVLGPTWPKVGAVVFDLAVAALLVWWLVRSGRRRVSPRVVVRPDHAEFLEDQR